MVARDTPKSRQKVKLLANALLVPVIIWALSSFLLSRQVLRTSIFTAIIASICCTVVIFLAERIMLMSKIDSKAGRFNFIMGGCIALIGSLTIDEIVFAEDIDYQLQKNKEKYAAKAAAEQGVLFDSIHQMPLKFHALLAMKASLKEAEQLAMSKTGDNGSDIEATADLGREEMVIADSRRSILMKDKNQYDALLQQKTLLMQTVKDRALIESNDGLIVRVRAFFTLVFSDWLMAVVFTLFLALMFCLEFLVVIVKKVVPESNYEKRIKLIDEIGELRMNLLSSLTRNWRILDLLRRAWSRQKISNP